MKKIMILAAVVCAAVATQAASFNWKTSATGKVYEAGTTTLLGSATAYLFNADTLAQADLFTALVAGSDIATLGSLDSASVSAGAIAAKTSVADYISIEAAAGTTVKTYMAIVSGDDFFISNLATVSAKDVGVVTISFNVKTASQAASMDSSAGYAGAGWYQTVPEPTSGLLLLLGMAGLALKRKQA